MEGPICAVSTPDLVDQITELAGHLNAAQARWLALTKIEQKWRVGPAVASLPRILKIR